MGVCEGRRADAIPIRASHRGQTRYIRSPAASRRAVGAGEVPRCPERAAVSWLKGTATPPPHALSRRASGPPPSLPHPHRQICAQSSEPEGGAMRSAPSRCAVARALVLAGLWLAAAGRPLAFSDAGPHVHYGWGESVRLRHLYTAGPQGLYSCFLRIHSDGAVDCAQVQSAHSECPPGPHPSQRPFFPLPPSRSRNPGSWHLAISPSPTPRLREELGEGATGAWTYCTDGLPSPSPTSASADPPPPPPFRGTPGLGTWAFHSHPEPPDMERGWGVGEDGPVHPPTTFTSCGPRGFRLQFSAVFPPRFDGDQGGRSEHRSHQGRAQRAVPLHGRRRQDARTGRCLGPAGRAGARACGAGGRAGSGSVSLFALSRPVWNSEGKAARPGLLFCPTF